MPSAMIKTSDGTSRLRIEIEREARSDSRWLVTLETADLRATHGFWSGAEPERLADFFDGLAREWMGWEGDKVFASVEHDFLLRATHDGRGHILLWARLGTHVAADEKAWHAVAPLAFEAGQLDQLAASVRGALEAK